MTRHPFIRSDITAGNLFDDTVLPVCARCSYPEHDPRHVHNAPDRLFTLDGETFWSSIAEALRETIDVDGTTRRDFKVEESTVVDPVQHLCSSDHLIDTALDWASDNGEIDEYMDAQFRDAAKLPHVVEAFDRALRMLAASTTYRMADEKIATHVIEVHVHPGGGWSWSTYLDSRNG